MSVDVIASVDGVAPVLDAWRSLAEARGSAFVTPEWYLSALRDVDGESAPTVAVWRRSDGSVRGVLPLVRSSPSGRSARLGFPAPRLADIFVPVAASGDDDELAAAAAIPLARDLSRRCEVDLGRVGADATWWRELAAAWPSHLVHVPQPPDPLPLIELSGLTWDDYLAARSGQFRNQVGRKMRALRRDHEVTLRRSAGAEEVARDMATLFRLHDARWRDRPGTSSVADPAVRSFHGDFALAADERGWLRLFILEADGVAVAAWYGWRVGDRFSYYQAGFDPDWSRYSIGFLLLAETVREAIAEGALEYDLLLGDESFKARFATGQRWGRKVVLVPPLSRRHAAATAERLARAGVRAMPDPLRDRLRAARAWRRGR